MDFVSKLTVSLFIFFIVTGVAVSMDDSTQLKSIWWHSLLIAIFGMFILIIWGPK